MKIKHKTINCRGRLIDLSVPKIMGVINITPDSFYAGGRYSKIEDILEEIEKMLEEGADIIDIGAVSSRPGAIDVSETEEKKRLFPVLEAINRHFDSLIISIDTYRSEIVREVINTYKVSIINDISGGELDSKMFVTIAELKVPYILMHMKGIPKTMQKKPEYDNLMRELNSYFARKISALKMLGVSDIIIDPGFGFGKTLEHNYELLQKLDALKIFSQPILVGISRKSMIYNFLELSPQQALNGTTVLNTIALTKGANILRVHDVSEAKQTVKLIEFLKKFEA